MISTIFATISPSFAASPFTSPPTPHPLPACPSRGEGPVRMPASCSAPGIEGLDPPGRRRSRERRRAAQATAAEAALRSGGSYLLPLDAPRETVLPTRVRRQLSCSSALSIVLQRSRDPVPACGAAGARFLRSSQVERGAAYRPDRTERSLRWKARTGCFVRWVRLADEIKGPAATWTEADHCEVIVVGPGPVAAAVLDGGEGLAVRERGILVRPFAGQTPGACIALGLKWLPPEAAIQKPGDQLVAQYTIRLAPQQQPQLG